MDEPEEEFDLHVKLLMLGDTGVGKTCLLLKYVQNSFSPTFITTIGIDFKIKIINIGDMKVKLQIWDTAGQERFRTITVSYFKGAHAIMLVYDVTDRDTFDNIKNWVMEIKEYADPKVQILLVGNKCDCEADRAVSYEEGAALAASIRTNFFEVSAKENIRVAEAYEDIASTTKIALTETIRQATVSDSIQLKEGSNSSGSGCAC
mmetsp:Transcript_19824/g.28510  ORF Transcript_19824/g.28510 Transcript_19824/m.28510 type:complete len:205 (+) Transcript_19824:121-735(+)|eukprot:CAMPEP_0185018846 /NCGR_PEP_ID=MMETSP1103-20130426/1512_1 /TAXON_ID=36769 /ORGANISM="Paraphysomonas bandaiensis, Strain Caron Lab Isolate" /LENGTH=204 /DNA_ID=CAMNT_0027548851 /DNA_START=121 /DNA_END=735 /DNA_ORIENTATION=-